MITGLHALIYTSEPDAARAFFRDMLGFDSVDAGEGWLIFAMPPPNWASTPRTRAPLTSSASCATTSRPR